ncbi:MAG: phospholipase D-like domain-containing protein [Thiothrix sp.]
MEDLPDFMEIRPLLIDLLLHRAQSPGTGSPRRRQSPPTVCRTRGLVNNQILFAEPLPPFTPLAGEGLGMRVTKFTHDPPLLLPHPPPRPKLSAGTAQSARSYKRIAGYFTSSLFEVAHEELEAIPDVKIVCNVDIDANDLKVAQLREAKMIGRWNDNALEAEALWNRARYQRLDQFLAKRGQVIRVAPDSVCGFVHGKAGIIERADGRKLGFIGSMNETSSGWQRHYEILWEDDSPEGIAWLEAEFQFLWDAASPLPNAVIREVKRRGHRHEVDIEAVADDTDIAPAALIESPMYRQGLTLQPWQQEFVSECIRHYHNHGIVRLLLADEVGLGKTLSWRRCAGLVSTEKEQKRLRQFIIFAPATLYRQWQTELIDKLGIRPLASPKKRVVGSSGTHHFPAGRERIAQCPLRIDCLHRSDDARCAEKQHLLDLRYALVILDEAHKARSRQGFGKGCRQPQ